MKKSLIIGVATLALTGTALISSGIYAATTESSTTTSTTEKSGRMEKRGHDANIVASLSGKVSSEALTALETLMNTYKAAMDSAKANTGTFDKTTLDTQHAAFKTEMDALITKYPELKTALEANRPKGEKNGNGKRNRGGNAQINTIISSLPTDAQSQITTIRENYKTKFDTLRTEEETQIEAIIGQYPDVKTQYDAAKATRPTQGDMHDPKNNTPQTTTSTGA